MKNFLTIAIVVAVLSFTSVVHAQIYSINWHTIAGGGGSSSGSSGTNTFTVTGTIGQPATASMSGGSYSLTGGFWSILAAVQTPGSPLLSIVRSGTQAVVSWNGPATGFVLQQSSSLLSTSWTNSTATLTTNSGTGIISVTVPAASGYQYFRLLNP